MLAPSPHFESIPAAARLNFIIADQRKEPESDFCFDVFDGNGWWFDLSLLYDENGCPRLAKGQPDIRQMPRYERENLLQIAHSLAVGGADIPDVLTVSMPDGLISKLVWPATSGARHTDRQTLIAGFQRTGNSRRGRDASFRSNERGKGWIPGEIGFGEGKYGKPGVFSRQKGCVLPFGLKDRLGRICETLLTEYDRYPPLLVHATQTGDITQPDVELMPIPLVGIPGLQTTLPL